MLRVDDIKRPLLLGEEYFVPCIVRTEYHPIVYEQTLIEERYLTKNHKLRTYITPVINSPHNDIENGQKEVHYHADFRFIKTENVHVDGSTILRVINKHSKYYFCEFIRPEEKVHGRLEYMALPVVSEEFAQGTPVGLIKNSKLKHKCIHKGKCPHRGYDLSQVKPSNGIITCPLHGLTFDSTTKQLLLDQY